MCVFTVITFMPCSDFTKFSDLNQIFLLMEKIMPLYSTENIPGKQVELLGVVKGSMIQSKHLGRDIGSALKTLVGGELRGYSEMLNEARAMATKRMVEEANALNADAIVNIRYATSAIMQGAAEILVYGTAVKYS
jgi:uncharacterized protein YbjQ (UPF0145 family)